MLDKKYKTLRLSVNLERSFPGAFLIQKRKDPFLSEHAHFLPTSWLLDYLKLSSFGYSLWNKISSHNCKGDESHTGTAIQVDSTSSYPKIVIRPFQHWVIPLTHIWEYSRFLVSSKDNSWTSSHFFPLVKTLLLEGKET